MEDSELKIMYTRYKRQRAKLDKLWDNILNEIVKRAKEKGIEME